MSHKVRTRSSIAVTFPRWWNCSERAYEIIKTIDPGAMVLTPSPVGGYGPPWMSRFLAAGGGKYADIMAFHGYLAPGADAESIIATIRKFKSGVRGARTSRQNRFGIRKQVGAEISGFRTQTCRRPFWQSSTCCTGPPASNDSIGTPMTTKSGERYGTPKTACIKQASPTAKFIVAARRDYDCAMRDQRSDMDVRSGARKWLSSTSSCGPQTKASAPDRTFQCRMSFNNTAISMAT